METWLKLSDPYLLSSQSIPVHESATEDMQSMSSQDNDPTDLPNQAHYDVLSQPEQPLALQTLPSKSQETFQNEYDDMQIVPPAHQATTRQKPKEKEMQLSVMCKFDRNEFQLISGNTSFFVPDVFAKQKFRSLFEPVTLPLPFKSGLGYPIFPTNPFHGQYDLSDRKLAMQRSRLCQMSRAFCKSKHTEEEIREPSV